MTDPVLASVVTTLVVLAILAIAYIVIEHVARRD